MSIAAIVAAALSAALPAAPAVPPIVVDLATVTEVSPAVISIAIEETQELFRSAGVRFLWRQRERTLGALRVVIGADSGPPRDNRLPLGWVTFENGEPLPEIHLSFENVQRFMEQSREVVGIVTQKTIAERELLLGRAMGRALAHELGHYLLATTRHTSRGLLKGSRTAQEFFSRDRSAFSLNPVERRRIVARVRKEFDLVRLSN